MSPTAFFLANPNKGAGYTRKISGQRTDLV